MSDQQSHKNIYDLWRYILSYFMSKQIHYLPVGFDFERMIQPLFKDDFDVDKVILITSGNDPSASREGELAERIADNIERSVRSALGIDVSKLCIPDMYDYMEIYEIAHREIKEKIEDRYEIYVNISSMPRTVAFSFATAIDTHILRKPELRNQLHTYYVAPEKYLMVDVMELLEEEKEFLVETSFKDDIKPIINERLEDITDLLQKLETGTTTSPRELDEGEHHVEFVAPPVMDLEEYQVELLSIIHQCGDIDSISELARKHAKTTDEECDRSYISKTQYRVEGLEDLGLVERDDSGQGHRIYLTKIGEIFVATNHPE